MEHSLSCNNLKCRTPLSDRALVTTCSHIFCLDCATQLHITSGDAQRQPACPACNSQLPGPEDAVVANLNPSEEYKNSVLSGLGPNIIMECAGRALSFWAYQTTQDICYQQFLYKSLAEKYSNLNLCLEKTVNDANSELESLQNKLSLMQTEHEAMRRRNDEMAQAYKDKSRKLLQTQELYDKVKRKAEMGQIQRAASDAVDNTLQHDFLQAQESPHRHFENRMPDRVVKGMGHEHPRLGQTGMSMSIPRGDTLDFGQRPSWSRFEAARSMPNNSETNIGLQRARPNQQILFGHAAAPPPVTRASQRPQPSTSTPNFANRRSGFNGIGLTSGLKVSQPAHQASLEATTGHRL